MNLMTPASTNFGSALSSPTPPPAPAYPYLPEVGGLNCIQAALAYIAAGIPVAPFDPDKGNGKQCWNMLNYDELLTTANDVEEFTFWNGEISALATSPGAIAEENGSSAIVLDIDKPGDLPRDWRKYVRNPAVPFVATRPTEEPRRGHYWFWLPAGVTVGNRAFDWGELRSVGGGVVLPPYRDRVVKRTGKFPPLPVELSQAFASSTELGRGRVVGLDEFIARYTQNTRPHKLKGLERLHAKILRTMPPHDAMRTVLSDGLAEARLGYVPASQVIATMRSRWPVERSAREFDRLVHWCADWAQTQPLDELKAKSDRPIGMDSRRYATIKCRR